MARAKKKSRTHTITIEITAPDCIKAVDLRTEILSRINWLAAHYHPHDLGIDPSAANVDGNLDIRAKIARHGKGKVRKPEG